MYTSPRGQYAHGQDRLGSSRLLVEFPLERYELYAHTKSRGQIHLHLLGITNDALGRNGIQTKLYKAKNDKKKQARVLAKW